MKKIETQEDKEKRRKRNNLIVGVIMIALIGLSSLGYAIMSRTGESTSSQVFEYGNLKFFKGVDYWTTTINNKQYSFFNLPNELVNVSIAGNYSLADYSNKAVYFVGLNSAVYPLNYLFDGIVLRTQETCLANQTCANAALPVKDCSENIFIFDVNKTETKVYKKQNCVFLEGNSYEAVDKVMYRLLNIA